MGKLGNISKAEEYRFKSKNKKLLRAEITEMISTKEIAKEDLIILWQSLNKFPNL